MTKEIGKPIKRGKGPNTWIYNFEFVQYNTSILSLKLHYSNIQYNAQTIEPWMFYDFKLILN